MPLNLRCPRCQTTFEPPSGRRVTCPACGYAAPTPPRAAPPVTPPAPSPAPASPHTPSLTQGRFAAGLLLNLVLPGVGTRALGRTLEGALQLAVFIAGLATVIIIVGLALVPAAWVWAQVSTLQAGLGRRRNEAPSAST